MTNLEAIRRMELRDLAQFIAFICGNDEFRKELCSKKTCMWVNAGACYDKVILGFCWGALANWLGREIDKPGYMGTSLCGRSHRKLWDREKITRYIKRGYSRIGRDYAWGFQKPKVTGRLKKRENKETDGTAIEHTKAAELPF